MGGGPAGRRGRPVKKPTMPDKGPAVICDFDDTTVLENVAEMLLKKFGGEGWEEYQKLNVRHRMSLKEYQERAFQTVGVSREEMKNHVKENATLRGHFKELYEHCRENDIPLAIATMGLDFYVEALLEREGMESVETYAADTEFTDEGIRYEYRYASKDCWQPGNCKCVVLERYRDKGHSVIFFAGDGKTDICPADRSDRVFARRYLEEHREEQGLPYVKLTDFSNMVKELKELRGRREEDGFPPSATRTLLPDAPPSTPQSPPSQSSPIKGEEEKTDSGFGGVEE